MNSPYHLKEELKMSKISFYLSTFFILIGFRLLAQTEQEFFNIAARHYYNGDYKVSLKTIENGLTIFPNDKKLLKLKSHLSVDTKVNQWNTFQSESDALRQQGYEEGKEKNGYVSKVLIDPNGKKITFIKKAETISTSSTSTDRTNEWQNFNNQEKRLLNNGFIKGSGNDNDEIKNLTDPNGQMHYYFKKKPTTSLAISAQFKKTAQNSVQWSNDLKNNAEKITIIFNNGIKTFSEEVTGLNFYRFESGDKDFDGVECTVTLKVILKPNVKMIDNPKLSMKTHC